MGPITLPFVCPICGAKSWHPSDAVERYCARCRRFVDLPGTPTGRLATVLDLMHVPVVDEHGNDTGETESLISAETARVLLDAGSDE
jgi:hypothetical protein